MTGDRPVTVAYLLATATEAGLHRLADVIAERERSLPEIHYEQVVDDRGRALMVHTCGHPRWVRADASTVSQGRCGKCFGGGLVETWTPAYRRVTP